MCASSGTASGSATRRAGRAWRYLLDTNIASYLGDRASPLHAAARERLAELTDADEVTLSVLSLQELHHWLAYRAVVRVDLARVLRAFTVVPLPEAGAGIFGALMRELRRTRPRGDLQRRAADCMIAATALQHGAVLVSNDALFTGLATIAPALRVADWTSTSPPRSAKGP